MICEHPECTGKHANREPVSETCPAARERRKEASRRRSAAWRLKNKEAIRQYDAAHPRTQAKKDARRARAGLSPLAQCCREATGRVCAQHKQWTEFRQDGRAGSRAQMSSVRIGQLCEDFGRSSGASYGIGFSMSRNPDDYWPDSAEDRAQERAIAEWLAIA